MIEDGLIEEVQGLINRGIDKNCQCMQGIGYKETYDAILSNNFDNLSEIIKLNTRHYAKRQITFFKRMQNHTYLSPEEATADRVYEILNNR
jgi:tRNA dimethylallyltransferase